MEERMKLNGPIKLNRHKVTMLHRCTVTLLLAVGVALTLTGCGKKEEGGPSAGGGGTGGSGKKLKLAFVSNNAATFWTIARSGCQDAEKALGNVQVDFRIPSSGDPAEQQRILDDLLAKGVDGIAVSPSSPENQTEFLNKIAEQTLLV